MGSGTQQAAGGPPSAQAPNELLTFLFTDVESSTRLWEANPGAMRAALERHDTIIRSAVVDSGGEIVKTTGDGIMAVFAIPVEAVTAAIVAQHGLSSQAWPDGCTIRVRMGIHSGEVETRGGDYFGPAVNRTARIMSAGHGGQVLLSEATAGFVEGRLPDGATLRDLGEHRLKDLGRSQRIFQLADQGLPVEFAPLSTLDLRPNNLPTETSAFVGRDAELRAMRELLDDAEIRLITLTGPGGTGKTRLAIRAAADQIDRFTDGVYFVDLVTATDTDAVLALMVIAIGALDSADRPPFDELRLRLRTDRVLLVLDNFEQVAVAAPILVELLAECPGLKLLVTSRQALRVRGEHVISVPPLSLPAAAAGTSADELSQFEAIQLFVERARGIRSDFRLTDDNAAAVADICHRLDGLPLAIELATARLNLFSPEALRDRLASSLKALGSGARDLPERQQTLRGTIDWSYRLLTAAEQRLFELLSVFAGASIEAVESVAAELDHAAGAELDALDGLGSLVDKSLVRQVDTRVLMLETIKAYAAAQLDTQPSFAAAAREAHAGYFVQLATDATRTEDDVSADIDNLRVAWHHSAGKSDLERLRALRDALWTIYDARGWYHATIQLIDDLLGVLATKPADEERWREEVTLRTNLARAITLQRGYTAEAENAYGDVLKLVTGRGEVPQLFPVLKSLASFHGFRGEFDKGIEYATQIIKLADAQGDRSMRVDGLLGLGADTGFIGDLEGGLAYLDEAIEIFESDGYRARRLRFGIDPRVSCLTTSGFFLWHLGFPDRAVERANRAGTIATGLDHPYSRAYALFHAGFLHHWRGEPELVRDQASAALRVAEAADLAVWRALGTCLLGAATSALGRPDEGIRMTADGVDQYRGLRTPPVFWPFILYLQAGAFLPAGTPEPALRLLAEAGEVGAGESAEGSLFHTLHGDLLLVGPAPDVAAAAAAYERAYAGAEVYGARMSQLRAASRLVRLVPEPDRARWVEALRAVHATFIEGFETRDLLEARELLAN
jgi:predicted ATPase/class 3 adenylate cyclase